MKQIVLKFLLSFSLCMPLFSNMDARIKAIQNAPIEERFKLMNAFKKEIILMQEQERIEAITKLKSITQSKYGTHALEELKSHTINRTPDIDERDKSALKEEDEAKDHMGIEAEIDTENEAEEHIEDGDGEHIEDGDEEDIEDATGEDEHDVDN